MYSIFLHHTIIVLSITTMFEWLSFPSFFTESSGCSKPGSRNYQGRQEDTQNTSHLAIMLDNRAKILADLLAISKRFEEAEAKRIAEAAAEANLLAEAEADAAVKSGNGN